MALIVDQATLISEVAARLGRVDIDSTIGAVMVQLAVQQVNRDATNAGSFIGKEATATGTLTAGSENLAIPAGLSQIRVFELLAPYATKLTPQPLEDFITHDSDIIQGVPQRYAVYGANIVLGPTPSLAYSYRIRYIASADAAFMTANFPDVIFYATLMQATDYVRDEASIQRYVTSYQVALASALKNENRKRYGHMPPQLDTNQFRRFNIVAGR